MHKVQLYIYDLSQGMAASLSQQFLGTRLEAIYHTSAVVFNKEFYFGQGIQMSQPGHSGHGAPIRKLDMGVTYISQDVFYEYVNELSAVYTPEKYHLLDNNCNTFTNDVMQFLVGKGIPEYIINLPSQFESTPLGRQLRPLIDSMFGRQMAEHSFKESRESKTHEFKLIEYTQYEYDKITKRLNSLGLSENMKVVEIMEQVSRTKEFALIDLLRVKFIRNEEVEKVADCLKVFGGIEFTEKPCLITLLKLYTNLLKYQLKEADICVIVDFFVNTLQSGVVYQPLASLAFNLGVVTRKLEFSTALIHFISEVTVEKVRGDEEYYYRMFSALNVLLRRDDEELKQLVSVMGIPEKLTELRRDLTTERWNLVLK